MTLVATGLMNTQVAAEIGTSEVTVKVHRHNIMKTLGAKSLADLVRMADTLGLPHRSQTAGKDPKTIIHRLARLSNSFGRRFRRYSIPSRIVIKPRYIGPICSGMQGFLAYSRNGRIYCR
jgi:regulatory LuxR family protein